MYGMVVNAKSEKDVLEEPSCGSFSFCIVILYSLFIVMKSADVFAVLSALVHSGNCLQCYDPADLNKGTVCFLFICLFCCM